MKQIGLGLLFAVFGKHIDPTEHARDYVVFSVAYAPLKNPRFHKET